MFDSAFYLLFFIFFFLFSFFFFLSLVKSLENPDIRVVIIKEFAKKHFVTTEVLDFALAVEQCKKKKIQKTLLYHLLNLENKKTQCNYLFCFCSFFLSFFSFLCFFFLSSNN
jgi:hypothetical protein